MFEDLFLISTNEINDNWQQWILILENICVTCEEGKVFYWTCKSS